jgi:hypothetical protein
MPERFSNRHGYRGGEPEISVREDAPEGLRFAIPLIAQDVGMTPGVMRKTICAVLLQRPNPSNWSEYPNIWEEVNELIGDYHRVFRDWERAKNIGHLLAELDESPATALFSGLCAGRMPVSNAGFYPLGLEISRTAARATFSREGINFSRVMPSRSNIKRN